MRSIAAAVVVHHRLHFPFSTLHAVGNWLYYFFGVSGSGPHYGFWSGVGSDITEIAIFGGLLGVVRGSNCHHGGTWPLGCWRLGFHRTLKGHKLCKVHVALPEDQLDLHKVHPDHLEGP